jgi:hypothetical protein
MAGQDRVIIIPWREEFTPFPQSTEVLTGLLINLLKEKATILFTIS